MGSTKIRNEPSHARAKRRYEVSAAITSDYKGVGVVFVRHALTNAGDNARARVRDALISDDDPDARELRIAWK